MDTTATAALTLLSRFDDPEGGLHARLREELSDYLQWTSVLPQGTVRALLRRGDERLLRAVGQNYRLDTAEVRRIFQASGSAVATLRLLRYLAHNNSRAYVDGCRDLAAAVEWGLAADPGAWRRVVQLLGTFEGTPEELVTAARAGEGEGEGDGPVPPAPRGHTPELRQLLLLLTPGRLAALVPQLHRATVRDLARFGAQLPAETVEKVVADATPKQRLLLAGARWSDLTLADALRRVGDPELNAAVYLNPRTAPVVRARIMLDTATVPLDPALVARLCTDVPQTLQTPALWSGDPVLVRVALLRRRGTVHSVADCVAAWREGGLEALRELFPADTDSHPFRAPRYRGMLYGAALKLWERHGPQAALDLVDDLETMDRRQAAQLRAWITGGETGLAALRSDSEPAVATRRFVKRLRRDWLARLWPMLETPYPDWELVQRLDRRKKLSQEARRLLSGWPDCPAGLRRTAPPQDLALRAQWPVCGGLGWDAGRSVPGVSDATLTKIRTLSPGAVLGAHVPAREMLKAVARIGELPVPAAQAGHIRADLDTRMRTHLGGSAEAVVVALRLLPAFDGSVDELLSTAGAVAGVVPGLTPGGTLVEAVRRSA